MKPFPDIVDSLKDRKVGKNSQNPKDRNKPLKEEPDGKEDNTFCPLHQSNRTFNLKGFGFSPYIRN